jgi:hypothetical protein
MALSESGLPPLCRRAAKCGSSFVVSQKMTAVTAMASAQILATDFQP